MAEIPIPNKDEIVKELVDKMLPQIFDRFSPLVTIFKAVGIALLIYLIFLMLKALFSWRASHRLKKIAQNVEEINEKLDILIKKPKIEKSKKRK